MVRELFESDPEMTRERESLVSKVGGESRVNATLISTVSGHKENLEDRVDGFILAVVKE